MFALFLLITLIAAVLTADLAFRSLMAVANLIIGSLGFFKGLVPRKSSTMVMGLSLFQLILFPLIILAGNVFLLTIGIGTTSTEKTLFGVVLVACFIFMCLEIPKRFDLSWKLMTDPNYLEKMTATKTSENSIKKLLKVDLNDPAFDKYFQKESDESSPQK